MQVPEYFKITIRCQKNTHNWEAIASMVKVPPRKRYYSSLVFLCNHCKLIQVSQSQKPGIMNFLNYLELDAFAKIEGFEINLWPLLTNISLS